MTVPRYPAWLGDNYYSFVGTVDGAGRRIAGNLTHRAGPDDVIGRGDSSSGVAYRVLGTFELTRGAPQLPPQVDDLGPNCHGASLRSVVCVWNRYE